MLSHDMDITIGHVSYQILAEGLSLGLNIRPNFLRRDSTLAHLIRGPYQVQQRIRLRGIQNLLISLAVDIVQNPFESILAFLQQFMPMDDTQFIDNMHHYREDNVLILLDDLQKEIIFEISHSPIADLKMLTRNALGQSSEKWLNDFPFFESREVAHVQNL
jgi:hypothetical protein